MRELKDCVALLFDGRQSHATSHLFTRPLRAWHVAAPLSDAGIDSARQSLRVALSEIDAAARAGTHVVLSLSYEATQGCEIGSTIGSTLSLSIKPQAHPDLPTTPWLQALAFDESQRLSREQALTWLKSQSMQSTAHLITPQSKIDESEFIQAIARIRALIAAGDTYQVNYTFPFVADLLTHVGALGGDTANPAEASVNPDAALANVYHDWVRDLSIPYGAFLMLPHSSVLSFSPELFFELKDNHLICRPMKGTAKIGHDDADTSRRVVALAADEKNQAENLMIVDLMRNDLARLPQTRAVHVPKLFEVNRYGALLQMTSTVRADLHAHPSLTELFDALFPCGSITGAPKHQTIHIINELEPFARGAYCGAVGHLTPMMNGHKFGQYNATFSVPIRTLESTASPLTMSSAGMTNVHRWPLQCNVGSGITYDSIAAEEWQESLLKAQFFVRHGQPFELIETMCAEQDDNDDGWHVLRLEQHRARMASSAQALGFVFDAQAFQNTIKDALESTLNTHLQASVPRSVPRLPHLPRLPRLPRLRLRLGLQDNGRLTCDVSVAHIDPAHCDVFSSPAHTTTHTIQATHTTDFIYPANLAKSPAVRFAIYPQTVHSSNPFLRHKTSVRGLYNTALAKARAQDFFDYVFVNEKGEVTEGARSSIFIHVDGEWLTPPLRCGLLAGTVRAALLANVDMAARESAFDLATLQRADEVILCNALFQVRAVLV